MAGCEHDHSRSFVWGGRPPMGEVKMKMMKDIIFRAISFPGEYLFPHFLRRIAIAHFRGISILNRISFASGGAAGAAR